MKQLLSTICIIFFFGLAWGQSVPGLSANERQDVVQKMQALEKDYLPDSSYEAILRGMIEVAKFYFEDAVEQKLYAYDYIAALADSLGRPSYAISAMNLKALVLSDRQRFSEALQVYLKNTYRLGEYDDWSSLVNTAWYYSDMGNLFFRMEFYPYALKQYRQAVMFFKAAGTDKGLDVAYNNLGLTYANLDQMDSSIYYYRQGLAVRRKRTEKWLQGHSHLYLAQSFSYLGEADSTESHIQKADRILAKSSDERSRRYFKDILILKAELLSEQQKWQESLQAYQRALNFKSRHSPRWKNVRIGLRMAQLQLQMENWEAARQLALQVYENKDYQFLNGPALAVLQEVARYRGNDALALRYAKERLKLHEQEEEKQRDLLLQFYRNHVKLTDAQKANRDLEIAQMQESSRLRAQRNRLFLALVFTALLGLISVIIYQLRRKMHRTRRKLYQLYHSIQMASEQSSNLLLMLNPEGKVEFINDKARSLFQIADGSTMAVGDHLLKSLHKKEEKERWQGIVERMQAGDDWQEEQSYAYQEGLLHMLISFMPVIESCSEKVTGLIAVGIDNTLQKQQNKQLKEQAQALDKANQSKEKIISVLAHDLKEGIFSTQSLSDIVLENAEEQSKESMLEYMELMHQNLTKTKYLLEEVLDWVRNQGDDLQPNLQMTDLNSIVESLREGFAQQIQNKNLTLINNLPRPLQVYGDANMLRSVLYNLLSNAIKFSPKDQGRIELFIRDVDEDHVQINIRDNGAGMTRDEVLQIKHMQGVRSRMGTAGEKGTGVGLRLIMDLLNMNHSRLMVESRSGEGSTFYFSLRTSPPSH